MTGRVSDGRGLGGPRPSLARFGAFPVGLGGAEIDRRQLDGRQVPAGLDQHGTRSALMRA